MIIEPWDSEMIFEKGKFYKTRGGTRAECLCAEFCGGLLFAANKQSEDEEYFFTNSSGRGCSNKESHLDIVSEWRGEQNVCADETAPSSDEKRERIISLIQGFGRLAVIANPRLHRQFTTFVDGLVKYIRLIPNV